MIITVRMKDGMEVQARYIRHLTTLTPPLGDCDIEEVEVAGGRRIAVSSSRNDGSVTPSECGEPSEYR